MEELKPCPFCDGEAEFKHKHWCRDMQFDNGHDEFSVICKKCHADVSVEVLNARYRHDTCKQELETGKAKAIEKWNRRVVDVD